MILAYGPPMWTHLGPLSISILTVWWGFLSVVTYQLPPSLGSLTGPLYEEG
jgi:hypothetical protein